MYCLYLVEKGLVVRTRSEKVDKVRRLIVEELMARAPDAPELVRLAYEYGADRNRFEKEASFCVLCGLCVRYCDEVKGKRAVGLLSHRGTRFSRPAQEGRSGNRPRGEDSRCSGDLRQAPARCQA